ncbi:methyltransferase [bacterium]|nr:methyltransferase [bacterium]
MPFSFPLQDLADWLHQNGYYQACNVPAFTTQRVCPVQNVRFERRLQSGLPLPLGAHSHPSRFLGQLSPDCQNLYRVFYLHEPGDLDRTWPGLADSQYALWQISPLWTMAGTRYIVSSIPQRSPGEFVYLGDDSGLLIEASWRWLGGRGQGRVADLCCGCGVVGLSLPEGFTEVVGLDANPTALRLAEVNHQLNHPGLPCSFVLSDMWQAGRGLFDYVVGNPPALPVGSDLLYAYGGEDPASLTLRAIEGLGDMLAPGGKCLLLSFSVRDRLWQQLQQRLSADFSLEYEPRKRLIMTDPQLGWMEHVWIRIVRDHRGRRIRKPMSWLNWASQWSLPWLQAEPPPQRCYAGSQRSSQP